MAAHIHHFRSDTALVLCQVEFDSIVSWVEGIFPVGAVPCGCPHPSIFFIFIQSHLFRKINLQVPLDAVGAVSNRIGCLEEVKEICLWNMSILEKQGLR